MKQQILVIHGGNTFKTHEEYLDYLTHKKKVSLDKLRRNGWKDRLQGTLGDNYDVLLPHMPNSENARYGEWKIWLEKIAPLLDEEVILVGHSLGGITLVKYLSENDFPKKIKAVFLIAPAYDSIAGDFDMADFMISADLKKIFEQVGKVFIYHSKDDEVVPFSNFERYETELPEAVFRTFEDRGHFNQTEFPEIVEDIKSLI